MSRKIWMEKRTLARLAVVAVTTVVMSTGSAAVAADDGNVTGGDISGPGDETSAAMQAQNAAKSKMADAYVRAKYHGGSVAAYEAAYRTYRVRYPGAMKGLGAGDDFRKRSTRLEAAEAQFSMNRLGVNHEGQIKNFYCGPASGKLILRWLGNDVSRYSGVPLKQSNVADANHMRTDINGRTSWASGLFRIGINKWREGSSSGSYIDDSSPSAAEFESHLVYNTDRGLPVAADTVEYKGTIHYNQHPLDQTIGHWIVAEGYYNYGDGTYFVDPGTPVFPDAAPEFKHATGSFATTYLQANGVTW